MLKIIKHISLDHLGGYYFYRIHEPKLNSLSKSFPEIKNYVNSVFTDCPHSFFNSGPRSSSLKFKLKDLNIIEVLGHEISNLARLGLKNYSDRYSTSHSKVQVFMLENDSSTVAVEVPLWLQSSELDSFKTLFSSEEPLTGHIDILRLDNNKIWVWDFKPNAVKEKFASTQVYFYALMLSKRTDIPLEKFRCGYFDDKTAFIFKPETVSLEKNFQISSFLPSGFSSS